MNATPLKKPAANGTSEASEAEHLESRIRERAYELYEARGGRDGHELEDWLRAKEEITEKTEKNVRSIAA